MKCHCYEYMSDDDIIHCNSATGISGRSEVELNTHKNNNKIEKLFLSSWSIQQSAYSNYDVVAKVTK
jgi:hypothetical protein